MARWFFGVAYCVLFALLGVAVAAMVGCNGGSGSSADGQGTLQVLMTDASTDQYAAIYVTVDRVEVQRGGESGEWVTVGTPRKTCNLLSLVNGVTEDLGLADIPAGHYTQLRLILGSNPDDGINKNGNPHPHANYLILAEDWSVRKLKVPSGMQTGIKVIGGFDVEEGGFATLILDFDAARSVVKAGESGQWLLKPTIKLLPANECATIQGAVNSNESALAGALVSAQIVGTSADGEPEPSVASATLSGENGGYLLSVDPGQYTVVAHKTGFAPACGRVSVGPEEEGELDFNLAPTATGTLSGTVTLSGVDNETPVTVSVRASVTCGDEVSDIEIASLQLAHGAEYSLALPVGVYEVVYTLGGESRRMPCAIEAGVVSDLDITL